MLRLDVKCGMTLYHAATFNELKIERTITQEYEENSEKYKKMCELYEEDIGFPRVSNEDNFDKALLNILADECKKRESETIRNIETAFNQVCRENKKGVLNYAGYLIRIQDFCVLRVDEFKVNIRKAK